MIEESFEEIISNNKTFISKIIKLKLKKHGQLSEEEIHFMDVYTRMISLINYMLSSKERTLKEKQRFLKLTLEKVLNDHL